ncbi:unnamed protein product [Symbiodinium sp. CCMP2592]|nr:unnamed protein product [Symbiodinium sp. CCMP2592]
MKEEEGEAEAEMAAALQAQIRNLEQAELSQMRQGAQLQVRLEAAQQQLQELAKGAEAQRQAQVEHLQAEEAEAVRSLQGELQLQLEALLRREKEAEARQRKEAARTQRSEEKSAAPRWGYLREWCFVRVLTSDSCCQRLIDVGSGAQIWELRLVLPWEYLIIPKTEDSRFTCGWDGDSSTWPDFVRKARLAFERTPRKRRHLLGPDILTQLSGRAWIVTQEIDHSQLVRRNGVIYLLQFLETRLGPGVVHDVGTRLENLILRLRRPAGQSFSTWASRLREAYRQLQQALGRVRKTQPAPTSGFSPKSSGTRGSPARASGERSSATMEEPHGEADTENLETETLPGEGPAVEEDDVVQVESPRISPTRSRTPFTTRDAQTSMSAWRKGGRKDKDSDSDTSQHALQDLKLWESYNEVLEEALPSELLGWLLLRRAGLSNSARLNIQAAAGNSLRLDSIEAAMRAMEDELLGQEVHHRGHGGGPRRRTFWVEDQGHWSMLLMDEEDMTEILETTEVHYYGEDHSLDEDQSAEDYWAPEFDEGTTWWGDAEWQDDPSSQLSPEELKEVEEAYAMADGKLRNFVQAKQAVKAQRLSRGFYPFQPSSKGKKGKGKGKGKKGKRPFLPSPSSPASATSLPVMQVDSVYAMRPGDQSYTGCFICGDKNHTFRECPRRKGKGRGSVNFNAAGVFMLSEPEVLETPEVKDISLEESVMMISSLEPEVIEHLPGDLEETVLLQERQTSVDLAGFAVLDSGATETVCSLPALEALMIARRQSTGRSDQVQVTDEPPKRFKFGNGAHGYSASHVLLPQRLGELCVNLGVFTLDVQGVPLLIGVKTLRRLHAVLDFHRDVIVFGAVDPSKGVPLRRSRTGHLLLDLREDWMSQAFDLLQPRAGAVLLAQPEKTESVFMIDGGVQSDQEQVECQSVHETGHGIAVAQSEPHAVEGACESDRDPAPPSHECQHEANPNAVAQDRSRELPVMRPFGILVTLLASHGHVFGAAGDHREQWGTQFEGGRQQRADPRDPRYAGAPCFSHHVPEPPGKGSRSGANQHGQWVHCKTCGLRLSYTPRVGKHGLRRSPGPLPEDTSQAVKGELPDVAVENLRDKEIGWAAAEKSAEKHLAQVRAQRQAAVAKTRGAAPKALARSTAATPNGYPDSHATQSSAPTTPSETIVVTDSENLSATPGRKAPRSHEMPAETQEYESRGK